ncbi:uncharacterized protein LOC114732241 [Neltuma alba]|uniref:uncharacterized protein LOC114732241 n=1 Tax=Neltuma alba TaxID=207710 RepID=UPI0010A2E720|nr:uncharacterized protein LOC114732241 [Prosopis alba]
MLGGIWILWDEDNIKIHAIEMQKQYIHCEVEGVGARKWMFTAIYASPRERERKDLWENLKEIAKRITRPWMLAGDYNDIRDSDEQTGGGQENYAKWRRFSENIEECLLLEVSTEGPKYTWKGPVIGHARRLYKKLDRVLCHADWRNIFCEAQVQIGPRLQSNHHPLVIHITHPTMQQKCQALSL